VERSDFTQPQGSEAGHALSCLQQALKNFVGIEQAKAVWSAAT